MLTLTVGNRITTVDWLECFCWTSTGIYCWVPNLTISTNYFWRNTGFVLPDFVTRALARFMNIIPNSSFWTRVWYTKVAIPDCSAWTLARPSILIPHHSSTACHDNRTEIFTPRCARGTHTLARWLIPQFSMCTSYTLLSIPFWFSIALTFIRQFIISLSTTAFRLYFTLITSPIMLFRTNTFFECTVPYSSSWTNFFFLAIVSSPLVSILTFTWSCCLIPNLSVYALNTSLSVEVKSCSAWASYSIPYLISYTICRHASSSIPVSFRRTNTRIPL